MVAIGRPLYAASSRSKNERYIRRLCLSSSVETPSPPPAHRPSSAARSLANIAASRCIRSATSASACLTACSGASTKSPWISLPANDNALQLVLLQQAGARLAARGLQPGHSFSPRHPGPDLAGTCPSDLLGRQPSSGPLAAALIFCCQAQPRPGNPGRFLLRLHPA
jgi:hypothetical protein